jgi:hypothetical protein
VSVTVSRAVDAGVLVEVTDRGLGMSADDLRAANERLALGGEVTPETAKRMGLFVVGRLARRHEATVRLRATDALDGRPGVTASVHLPGALIAPPADIADTFGDPLAGSFGDAPLRSAEHELVPDRELWSPLNGSTVSAHPDDEVGSPASTPTNEPSGQNGSALPKRSPGASGVNGVAAPEVGRTAAATPDDLPARQPVSNTFAYFTPRSTPEAPEATPESEGSPIFERMMSEWLMDPTTRESRDGVWVTAADAGWAAAAKADDQKPQRHTDSGLPIRERGARLVPGNAKNGTDAATDAGRDPAAVGNMLSRAMAGVRSGRAESTAAHRRTEGDR